MTKREMTKFANKIKKLEAKLATKRDEVRTILGDIDGLVEDFTNASETMDTVLHSLQTARLELEGATDTMSQLV